MNPIEHIVRLWLEIFVLFSLWMVVACLVVAGLKRLIVGPQKAQGNQKKPYYYDIPSWDREALHQAGYDREYLEHQFSFDPADSIRKDDDEETTLNRIWSRISARLHKESEA